MNQTLKKPMTRQGFERLATEFNHLRDQERPKVVAGVATAAAEGDRSENAEYIYGKKRLREIDKRLAYLTGLLEDVQIHDPKYMGQTQVYFGGFVEVVTEANATKVYQIVGEGETDADAGRISWKSPVGSALMGKKVGSHVEIQTPSGLTELEIRRIF